MLKNFFKKIAVISLELILISGALWFVAEKKGIKSPGEIIPAIKKTVELAGESLQKPEEKIFPAESEPKEKIYNWEYKGKKYTLSETLFESSYQHYESQPKTFSYFGNLPENWEEEYYGMFLKGNNADRTIEKLAADLQELGRKNKLSDDQIVELTMSFVQAISYDDARASEILSKNGDVKMQYPFETLFLQKGVCSDKSLLATVILRKMGYGTALFAFEDDNHMAIGIKCPESSSTYGSGYCYAETTSTGNKIGIIPSFDARSNKTVSLENFDLSQQENLRQLGRVTIFQKFAGKEYNGVAATEKTIQEISTLKKQIDLTFAQLKIQQKNINEAEDKLKEMQKDLQKLRDAQSVENYNSLAKKYNKLLEDYKDKVKKYNSDVTLYNQTIARYNLLIRQ